jgi:hypothetical protein
MEINFTNPAAALPHCKFASDRPFRCSCRITPLPWAVEASVSIVEKDYPPGAKGSVFIP